MRSMIASLPKLFKSLYQRKKIKSRNINSVNSSLGFYELSAELPSGEHVKMEKFAGKKVMIVNLASECGYTYQYKALQKLSDDFSDKLIVLGFPCNDFGGQEPGSDTEIEQFCHVNFGVTFPLFKKISMKQDHLNSVYEWLSDKEKNSWNEELPSWNFCKYLIDEKGNLLKFFGSSIDPLSEEITNIL